MYPRQGVQYEKLDSTKPWHDASSSRLKELIELHKYQLLMDGTHSEWLSQGRKVLIMKNAEHQASTTPDRIPSAICTKMPQHITVGCKMSQYTWVMS